MLKLLTFLQKTFSKFIFKLSSPKNLSFLWNFGSFLGFIFVLQIFSGVCLTFFYSNTSTNAFLSIEYLERLVNNGFVIRCLHMNMASLFFFIAYMHMFRGMFYFSFRNSDSWNTGVTILLFLMATSFLGYVLPWGQMSFWAATVITKFFSVIPIWGLMIVQWIWSGFSVNDLTLKFFFCLHFLMPMILVLLMVIHLISIHFFGSTNPLFITHQESKLIFSPFFVSKDLLNLFIMIMSFMSFNIWFSSESVNFVLADYSSSPAHIKPEWYFLFVYAILRSVPNKLLGVILMVLALAFFYGLSLQKNYFMLSNLYSYNKFIFFLFIFNFIFLSWIGGNTVTDLFVVLGFISSMFYFLLFFVLMSTQFFLKFLNL